MCDLAEELTIVWVGQMAYNFVANTYFLHLCDLVKALTIV